MQVGSDHVGGPYCSYCGQMKPAPATGDMPDQLDGAMKDGPKLPQAEVKSVGSPKKVPEDPAEPKKDEGTK